MAALEDEECQLKGVIDVVYFVGMTEAESKFSNLMTKGGHMLADLPFRMAGLHFCYSDTRLRPVLNLVQFIVGRYIRLRFRTHFGKSKQSNIIVVGLFFFLEECGSDFFCFRFPGSNTEVQYDLMTFGIPMSVIQINPDGSLKKELNERYLRDRRKKEANFKRQEDIEAKRIHYPLPNDVLLGRGRPYQEYAGNQRLAMVVELNRDKYQQATKRFEKTCTSLDVVKFIQESKGRFLHRTPEGWEEVSDFVARDKVSHSFRTKPVKLGKSSSADPASLGIITSKHKRIRYDEALLEEGDHDWEGLFSESPVKGV
jgi:hypothetical protein